MRCGCFSVVYGVLICGVSPCVWRFDACLGGLRFDGSGLVWFGRLVGWLAIVLSLVTMFAVFSCLVLWFEPGSLFGLGWFLHLSCRVSIVDGVCDFCLVLVGLWLHLCCGLRRGL